MWYLIVQYVKAYTFSWTDKFLNILDEFPSLLTYNRKL